jgi:hypothetical protein
VLVDMVLIGPYEATPEHLRSLTEHRIFACILDANETNQTNMSGTAMPRYLKFGGGTGRIYGQGTDITYYMHFDYKNDILAEKRL